MIQHNRQLWSRLKTRNVTVSVQPVEEEICVAFRVKASIDVGYGRQRVVLSALESPNTKKGSASSRHINMPDHIGMLECIYTKTGMALGCNVYKLIMANHPGARIEMIVPEVSAPGDYLVFRQPGGRDGITVIEALRVLKDHMRWDEADEGQG